LRLTRADWVRLLLLWLGGIDIRLTMLAVPPLIPLIHRDLHLDEKAIGAVVSGPVLILAIGSIPGSLLIARLGARGALLAGLGAVAVFGGLRGYGPSVPVLFTSTFLMGVGVAGILLDMAWWHSWNAWRAGPAYSRGATYVHDAPPAAYPAGGWRGRRVVTHEEDARPPAGPPPP